MKNVVIARLCGFQRVEWTKKDGSGTGSLYRCYFDYEDESVVGFPTASCVIYPDRFVKDRLDLDTSVMLVIENGTAEYAGRVPVAAAPAK